VRHGTPASSVENCLFVLYAQFSEGSGHPSGGTDRHVSVMKRATAANGRALSELHSSLSLFTGWGRSQRQVAKGVRRSRVTVSN
jgi:hypothetical protein